MADEDISACVDELRELAYLWASEYQETAEAIKMAADKLARVMGAVRDYHFALDNREHGGVAQDRAFREICETLGMHWQQGEEAARREGRGR
jgi:hypothetical protein